MNDAELAAYLGLSPEEAATMIPKIAPAARAAYERMRDFETQWNTFLAGKGPRPTGVLIDAPRGRKVGPSR